MNGKGLELRLVPAEDKRFRQLVRELDEDLIARFGDSARAYQQYNGLEHIVTACVVIKNGQAVACGAFQELTEDTAELKRIFVKPEFRGKGLGRQVVEALELQALWQGYLYTALSTGRGMKQAISLYRRLGYKDSEPWGPYVGDRACICLSKEIE